MFNRFSTAVCLIIFLLFPGRASALTAGQFAEICDTARGECSTHPLLQAYVGGALDLLATLTEETGDLEGIYCGAPREVFDVPAIIRFINAHHADVSGRNAMLLMVRHFRENGGCQSGE